MTETRECTSCRFYISRKVDAIVEEKKLTHAVVADVAAAVGTGCCCCVE